MVSLNYVELWNYVRSLPRPLPAQDTRYNSITGDLLVNSRHYTSLGLYFFLFVRLSAIVCAFAVADNHARFPADNRTQ